MKKILTVLVLSFGVCVSISAQQWQKIWSSDEAQWAYFWGNGVGDITYWKDYERIVFGCKDGLFEGYATVDPYQWNVDMRVEFYKNSTLSHRTAYIGCYCDSYSANCIILTEEETAPIWEWLTKGRNYSVRLIAKRYDMPDFDFVIPGEDMENL